jgi:hypothetical protein
MRQVAHFCVTLRHSCCSKTLKSPLFDAFLGPKSAQRPERHRFGAHHPQTWSRTARRTLSPFLRPPPLGTSDSRPGTVSQPLPTPTRLPLPPAIRGQGFPRSHGPAKDIVNHQRVNARLTLLRATAAGADEKSGGISGERRSCQKGSPGARCDRVAHICVTLRHCRDRKGAEIAAFRALFGPKSAVESSKWRKILPAQILTPSLQMLQKCSIVAHSVHSHAFWKFAPPARKFGILSEIRPPGTRKNASST